MEASDFGGARDQAVGPGRARSKSPRRSKSPGAAAKRGRKGSKHPLPPAPTCCDVMAWSLDGAIVFLLTVC